MANSSRRFLLASLLAVATVAVAHAQTTPYPNKAVQIIADSSAGSTPDVALRFIADRLTQLTVPVRSASRDVRQPTLDHDH